MRVNVDSKALKDPRFKRMGKALGVDWHEALGVCIEVWNYAYESRSEHLTREDVDAVAGRDGVADAMVAAELAELTGDDRLRLAGVRARIGFLLKQAERGRAGGKTRAARHQSKVASEKAKKPAPLQANAKRTLKQDHSDLDQAPDQDQDQVLAPDQDPDQPLVLIHPSTATKGSGTKDVIASFCDRYRAKYGHPYAVSPRNAGQIQRLVGKHGAGEVERRIGVLFDAPPWKLANDAPDIGVLEVHWNTLVGTAKQAAPRQGHGRAEPASAEQHAADAARGTNPWS